MSPRPTLSDPRVREETISRILPAVISWLAEVGDEPKTPEGKDDLKKELLKAFGYHSLVDGYHLAKNLERQSCWDPDSDLVDILESAASYEWDSLQAIVKDWVTESGITPAHKIGDQLTVKFTGFGRGYRLDDHGEPHTGTITRVIEYDGRYQVNFPTLGHVSAGEVGVQYICINWEVADA